MYDFIDRPVTALDRDGRFLIWCMRNWVRSMSAGRCPCAAIGPAFGQWGMVKAMPHFHLAMMTLNREARQSRFVSLLLLRRSDIQTQKKHISCNMLSSSGQYFNLNQWKKTAPDTVCLYAGYNFVRQKARLVEDRVDPQFQTGL